MGNMYTEPIITYEQAQNQVMDMAPRYGRRESSPQLKPNFIALFDYEKSSSNDITILKGDKLVVTDTSNQDWYYAANLRTEESGYVPTNYISVIEGLEIKDWYHSNLSRNEAERLLEYLDNKPGMFLIRDSETHSGKLVLSLLDYDEKRSLFTRHYKIEKHPNSKFSVVGVRNPTLFDTLDDLVEYYQKNFILKRKLTKPCLKEKKFAGIHDVWEEDRENIQLMKKLAEGNFGEVYLGLWRNKHTVAVKTLKKKSNHTLREAELSQQEFFRELELMKLIRHEKVVKLWCVCTRDEPVYLVTEFMCNGSLLDYLRKEQKNLNLKTLIDMASQIASGMRYLELNSYVHRDLAARNVLVGERNVCKIADFGLTKKIGSEKDSTGKPALPVKWTAPEVFTSYLQGNFSYDIKADVWSFGILLFEVITFGGVPYAGMTNNEILNKVQEGYRIPKPKGLCSNDYYDIMLKCWNKDPESRPTFDSLFNIFSDFFINIETKYVRND